MRVGGDAGIGYTAWEKLLLETSDGDPEIEPCRSGFRLSGVRGEGGCLFGVAGVTGELPESCRG